VINKGKATRFVFQQTYKFVGPTLGSRYTKCLSHNYNGGEQSR